MPEIDESHAKRIDALINAKAAAIVLLLLGTCMPLFGIISIPVGLLYGFEAHRLLQRYPNMGPAQFNRLQSAKGWYFVLAFVPVALWLLLGCLIAGIASSPPPR